jgi:hypothetical protein
MNYVFYAKSKILAAKIISEMDFGNIKRVLLILIMAPADYLVRSVYN